MEKQDQKEGNRRLNQGLKNEKLASEMGNWYFNGVIKNEKNGT
ncbi:hypothetical protein AAHN97_05000 [Chitinophaga niabensis]